MPPTIRQFTQSDRTPAQELMAEAVGEDFTDLDDIDAACSFVAVDGRDMAGIVTAIVRTASEALPEATLAGSPAPHAVTGPEGPARPASGDRVLHIRALAVSATRRRAGIASRLLGRAEDAGRAGGASLAVVYAWLPFGQSEPASVPLYESAGYRTLADLPGFYASLSEETGATCPYCGDPPCRCSARIMTKSLGPGRETGRS